jgi:flagellar biosynthesis repressor protein FlbT
MALKLRLKPNERVVINGCVVQNDARRHTLTISNFANVIRGSDILAEEDATTPARRAYFVIQSMLLDPKLSDTCGEIIASMLAKLYAALVRPEMQDAVMQTMQYVSERDYYKALACLRPVMAYEEIHLPGIRPRRAAPCTEEAAEPAGTA